MKCPKCGYNSFEYHDSCKKCAHDMVGFKGTFGLVPIVFPQEARNAMATAFLADSETSEDNHTESAEAANDMFAFDLPDDTASSEIAVSGNDDPFNFGDEPAAPTVGLDTFSFDDEPVTAQATADKDAFSSLLESTTQDDGDPFADISVPVAAQPVPVSSPGEFELNSFSWDDTPAPAAPAEEPPKAALDDFDSLFGDMDADAKK